VGAVTPWKPQAARAFFMRTQEPIRFRDLPLHVHVVCLAGVAWWLYTVGSALVRLLVRILWP